MKLYEGWRSSASWRVRWALALKRIAYESVLIDIAAGEQHTRLAALNPMRAVPTLELDDGSLLTESVAIIEWLDETHPEPALLPVDARARARVRELVQIINAGIHPLQNTITQRAVSSDPEAQRAWCSRWIERGLTAYEAHVAGGAGRFSLGEQLTMADLYLVPQVRNADRHGADITACRRVRQIYDACLETPEARATDPTVVAKRAVGAT
ncbi:MAG TPA: maleylacetoacetate isomerase [Kofleriaceae bacterium]|nr:maleylacetoacetate isomerase [Kofleriaceae bacterium]